MVNIVEYELLSMETAVFEDIELDLLRETLKVWKDKPAKPYELVEVREGRTLAGFCLFYKSPDTEYTFDIHSFVIGSRYRNSAFGGSLLSLVMDKVSSLVSCGVLRIETSRNKENSVADGFFPSHGFQLIGHIPDFYKSDNDYYIYMKQICVPESEPVKSVSGGVFLSDEYPRFISA